MAEYIIEVPVIKALVDVALEWRKLLIITDKAILIQLRGGKLDLDYVIVAMETRALMVVRKVGQLMRGGEMEFLGNPVHYFASSALNAPVAAIQKSGSS
jgi:hypothetical protein